MGKPIKLLLFLTILISLSGFVSATTYYVDPSGNDANNCLTPGTGCKTIQAAINKASNGDTILVGQGVYNEKINVNKQVNITGPESGPRPIINYSVSKYESLIQISADNVTIRKIEATSATPDFGYLISDQGNPKPGWTIDNVTVHDCRSGVLAYGGNIVIKNSEFYNMPRAQIRLHGSGKFNVTGNWIHDATYVGSSTYGVEVGRTWDGVSEVSYNYMTGVRDAIGLYYDSPIIISHNTLDGEWGLSRPLGATTTQGISLYGNSFNCSNIIIRDNIITNMRWYGLWADNDAGTTQLIGNCSVNNSLFWNNYYYYWPNYQLSEQWFGASSIAQVGWDKPNPGDGDFDMVSSITYDPFFKKTGTTPEEYYELYVGSPAINSASDGTHIGAWQGIPLEWPLEVWVDDDDVTCGGNSPCHFSIQNAINGVINGGTVNVRDGTYYESLDITKTLTLIGTGYSSSTVIDTSGFSAMNITADNVTIDGFDIKFYGTHAIMIKEVNNVTIKNSRINTTLDASLGIWVCGSNSGCQPSSNIFIENNTIIINDKATGIYVDNSNPAHSDFYIRNNVMNAPNQGVNVELYDVNDAFVKSNTFGKSGSVSLVYSSENSSVSNVKILNNTFLGNGNVSGVTPTIWIESDFILGDGDTSVTDVDITGNTFVDWTNGAILFGEDSSTNYNNILGDLLVNYNYFNTGSGFALKNNASTQINAEFNWWGSCSGPSGAGPGSGYAVFGNIDFTPWIGICIYNKTNVTCKYETDNITLSANISPLLDIDSVWMSYTINGTNYNGTATKGIGNNYSYTIPSYHLVGGMNVTWNVYVNDSFGNVYNNSWKTFYVRNRTVLSVNPPVPDGLDCWYITEPLFTLTSDGTANATWYRWDSTANIPYTGPFNLTFIPNFPRESAGTLELTYWSTDPDPVCGPEGEQSWIFYIDLVNPIIESLNPANSSVVEVSEVNISALLDDVYGSNSGIDDSSIIMKVDGSVVSPVIESVDTMDRRVHHLTSLSDGLHNVSIFCKDMAGHNSSIEWHFTVNKTPSLEMNVSSPENKTYGERRILINVTLNKEADIIEYSLDQGRFRRLCRDCDSYYRKKSFSNGWHNLTIRARKDGDVVFQDLSFLVDTREPKIYKTEPEEGTYLNGSKFSVEFREEFLREVIFHYGSQGVFTDISLNLESDCQLRRRKYVCEIELDLSSYLQQTLEYNFTVSDDLHSVDSEHKLVYVDKDLPIITIISPTPTNYSERRIRINVTVSEESDMYHKINDGRYRRLCRNCLSYDRLKSFRDGSYNLSIKAIDKTSKSSQENVSFTVDTKAPKIRNTEPDDEEHVKASVNFVVEYDEDLLNKVYLHYKEEGAPSFNVEELTGCTSGRRQQCSKNIDLSSYDGQWVEYYFNISDFIHTTISDHKNIFIDISPPVLNIYSPEDGETYTSRRVLLNLTTDEDSEIHYSVDEGRFRRICRSCSSYARTRYFSEGARTLTINATDKAGNMESASISFTVST